MALGLIGYKVGMTQIYTEDGTVEPVTIIQAGPCPVLQLRTMDRDGYCAVQLGFEDKPRSKSNRAEQGHVAAKLESHRKQRRIDAGVELLPRADCEPQRYIREFRVPALPEGITVGQLLKPEMVFQDVKAVDIIGTSKGRGYQGVMKRHGFAGLPAAHGAKKVHRQQGSNASLGSNRGTGRPKKGMRKAGQYGNVRMTIRNLKLVRIDDVNGLILVRGGIPGFNGSVILIRPTNKYGSRHGKVVEQGESKQKVVLKKKGK